MNIELVAQLGDVAGFDFGKAGKASIGKAHAFQHAQVLRILRQAMLPHALFRRDNLRHLFQEPWIDLAAFVNFLDREAKTQGLADHTQAVRCRHTDGGTDGIVVIAFAKPGDCDFIEAGKPSLKTT